MFKRSLIHYNDKNFGDILINYNQLKMIIIFLKISCFLL